MWMSTSGLSCVFPPTMPACACVPWPGVGRTSLGSPRPPKPPLRLWVRKDGWLSRGGVIARHILYSVSDVRSSEVTFPSLRSRPCCVCVWIDCGDDVGSNRTRANTIIQCFWPTYPHRCGQTRRPKRGRSPQRGRTGCACRVAVAVASGSVFRWICDLCGACIQLIESIEHGSAGRRFGVGLWGLILAFPVDVEQNAAAHGCEKRKNEDR